MCCVARGLDFILRSWLKRDADAVCHHFNEFACVPSAKWQSAKIQPPYQQGWPNRAESRRVSCYYLLLIGKITGFLRSKHSLFSVITGEEGACSPGVCEGMVLKGVTSLAVNYLRLLLCSEGQMAARSLRSLMLKDRKLNTWALGTNLGFKQALYFGSGGKFPLLSTL